MQINTRRIVFTSVDYAKEGGDAIQRDLDKLEKCAQKESNKVQQIKVGGAATGSGQFQTEVQNGTVINLRKMMAGKGVSLSA